MSETRIEMFGKKTSVEMAVHRPADTSFEEVASTPDTLFNDLVEDDTDVKPPRQTHTEHLPRRQRPLLRGSDILLRLGFL